MLACYPEFADYLKYFRTKVDKEYRKECQRTYIEKILGQSVLDSGSISNVLKYL
jgi:uncharacterized protein YbcI